MVFWGWMGSDNKVLTLLKMLKMEIQNFQILALMICNIASAAKVISFSLSFLSFLTFYSAQVIPHHPGASAIDIWAKCISEGQLQESFFNQFQPAVLLYWYQINSSMLTVSVSETLKRNVLEWTKLVKLWREDTIKKSITLKWDASNKQHVLNIFRKWNCILKGGILSRTCRILKIFKSESQNLLRILPLISVFAQIPAWYFIKWLAI